MKKHTVSLTDPQSARLELRAAELGISVAEYVRRIVDEHFDDLDHKKGA